MGFFLPEHENITVECDGEDCTEHITIQVWNYSQNSGPFEDILAGLDANEWQYVDDGTHRCYCPECRTDLTEECDYNE